MSFTESTIQITDSGDKWFVVSSKNLLGERLFWSVDDDWTTDFSSALRYTKRGAFAVAERLFDDCDNLTITAVPRTA